MGGPFFNHSINLRTASSSSASAVSTALHSRKNFGQFIDELYSILTRLHLENVFHHIKNLYQNNQFMLEGKFNGELSFLVTLLKRNSGKISILV